LTSFLSGSKRVLELLDMPLTIPEPREPLAWDAPQGAIRFRNVTFGYDRNQPVLKDISFDVRPGEMVGIVGRSGSGKTTMVNLLGRFYDVQEGSVEIDGIDVRRLSTQQLRERLGIVFQDSFLFRGTIWKNLAYGRPGTTIEEGLAAAKAAGAHDFIIRSSLGYETLLGERGAGLSGGEKQRLSIARTLLYDPRILVLDEATSNIDAEAEKSIQEALETLIHGRTTVAIAHRLSTLRNADRILVFDRGRLVEEGSHADLLAQDGVYARLVRIQTQVSKDPSVDRMIQVLDKPHLDDAPSSDLSSNESKPVTEKNQLRWLDSTTRFERGAHGELQVWLNEDGCPLFDGLPQRQLVAESAYLVRAFPASHADEFISVRSWNEDGDDIEVGMIRRLTSFSKLDRELLDEALGRHYLLRRIERLNSLELHLGFLDFDVQTEAGRERFSIRWTQSQAIDFGERGKILIDTEENRYVVADVEGMPAAQREKFLQYVYW
jgi:ATP-binding cassette subfamily B protein